MIVSHPNLKVDRPRYVISILVKAPYNKNKWKEFYVGKVDEGYMAWPYPVDSIEQACGYNTAEEAEEAWFHGISTMLVEENRNWKFDLLSASIREIIVSEKKSIMK